MTCDGNVLRERENDIGFLLLPQRDGNRFSTFGHVVHLIIRGTGKVAAGLRGHGRHGPAAAAAAAAHAAGLLGVDGVAVGAALVLLERQEKASIAARNGCWLHQ